MKKLITILLFATSLYSYGETKVQIQVAPVATLLGASNLEINYKFSDKFSVGFGGLRWEAELFDVDIEANESHGVLTYWHNGVFTDTWFGFLGYSNLGIELTATDSDDKEYTGNADGSGFILGTGKHWQWDQFNMQLGYSIGFYGFDSELELESSDGEVKDETIPLGAVGSLFYNIGWVF